MHPLTRLIREGMKPALGVTEPGAIAFAVAAAREHIEAVGFASWKAAKVEKLMKRI